jgi:hypothetical protein
MSWFMGIGRSRKSTPLAERSNTSVPLASAEKIDDGISVEVVNAPPSPPRSVISSTESNLTNTTPKTTRGRGGRRRVGRGVGAVEVDAEVSS